MPAYSGGTWTQEDWLDRADEVQADLDVTLASGHRYADRDAEALRAYLGWLRAQADRVGKRATA